MYSAFCFVLLLSCVQRLLCGFAFLLYIQRLLCGMAPILFTALAVWLGPQPQPVYSASSVVMFLSYVQRLLCGLAAILSVWCCSYVHRLLSGTAPILHTVIAVWSCFYMLCGIAPVLFTALAFWFCFYLRILCAAAAVWLGPYPVCSVCCVAISLSCLQRLPHGSCVAWPLSCLQSLLYGLALMLFMLFMALAVWFLL